MSRDSIQRESGFDRAQAMYDAQEEPEAPDVSGDFQVEIGGFYFAGRLPSLDDAPEIQSVSTEDDPDGISFRVGGWDRIAQHEDITMKLSKAFLVRLKAAAIEQLRREA